MNNTLHISYKMVIYNLKIIFGNKFIYFLLSAVIFYLIIAASIIFGDKGISEADVYTTLLFPGLLLIFYPTTFGIQNDADARTLEIIFGIPDYRYKVWLFRLIIVFVLAFLILIPLASLSIWALTPVNMGEMLWHLQFTLVFIGVLAFSLSTIIRNGNATAVIMIILGFAFNILSQILGASMWDIFINPFHLAADVNSILYAEIIRNNHIFLTVSSLIFLLIGLLNLQRREKFV